MSFSKNLLIYGIGNGISRFLQILLVPIFVRIFSTEVYGSYDLIYTMLSLAYLIGMLQLESFIARFFNNDNKFSNNNLISTALITIILISLSVSIIIIAASGKIANYLLLNSSQFVIVVSALSILPNNIYYFFTMLLRLDNKPILFLKISIVQVVINLLTALVLLLYFKIGIIGIFWSIFLSNTVASIWLLYIFKNYLVIRFDFSVFKEIKHFCLPSMPSVFISWFNNYANRFVMLFFLTKNEVGVFSASMKMGAVFIMLDMTLRMAWVPYFWTQFSKENHREIYVDKFKQITSSLIFLGIGFVFFADPLFTLITPIGYWDGSKLIEILGFNFLLYTLIGLVAMGPDIVKKTKYSSYFSIFSLIVNSILLLYLTPLFGLLGVAVSMLISSILLLFISWYVSEKLYKIGYEYKYLFLRIIPLILFVFYFQNQNSNFGFRIALYFPVVLLYIFIFERVHLKLIFNYFNKK